MNYHPATRRAALTGQNARSNKRSDIGPALSFLYPYQKDGIADESRLEIATKARRIGYSFAAGFKLVCNCLMQEGTKENQIVLSHGERQSKEFINESVDTDAPLLEMSIGRRGRMG
jgi:hypothetical protein